MLIVLSPAKSLDYKTPVNVKTSTLPEFVSASAKLIADLKKLAPHDVAKLMGLSDQLASLNVGRYRDWSNKFTEENRKPAIYTFDGDVYDGFDVKTLNAKAVAFAQDHLRILSGLYGVLKPLDLMQPYRLEMGTSLKNASGKDLYAFWGGKVTSSLKRFWKSKRSQCYLIWLRKNIAKYSSQKSWIAMSSPQFFRMPKTVSTRLFLFMPSGLAALWRAT